ncbi:hypothetical protein TUM3794_20410 [Shewanella colwelliana]|uniref:Uncharacterized protein n=1 Tax=Shewanella colwelliana TaxID=23 RepID=A0ABQ4P0H8_SHECO|nr:hypothetical protein [Shewanella colwelliana]GIU41016.1 hypothetical protein TUM3794_20410 [Shewanella colwelliana]
MKQITKTAAKTIRHELNAILEQYNKENKHGLTVTLGDASYTENSITFKTTAAVKIEGIPAEIEPTKKALDFLNYAELLGLNKSDLGRKFISNGREFTLCGYKPRSTKRPFVAKAPDGQDYVFEREFILNQFKA